jgi:hypothetical protein
MDQPAARSGGERRRSTLIYAGRCLKVVDKFRRLLCSRPRRIASRAFPKPNALTSIAVTWVSRFRSTRSEAGEKRGIP